MVGGVVQCVAAAAKEAMSIDPYVIESLEGLASSAHCALIDIESHGASVRLDANGHPCALHDVYPRV